MLPSFYPRAKSDSIIYYDIRIQKLSEVEDLSIVL